MDYPVPSHTGLYILYDFTYNFQPMSTFSLYVPISVSTFFVCCETHHFSIVIAHVILSLSCMYHCSGVFYLFWESDHACIEINTHRADCVSERARTAMFGRSEPLYLNGGVVPFLHRLYWLSDVYRDYATKLLDGRVNGTFLCRPASEETQLPSGGFHTYTIDCVWVPTYCTKIMYIHSPHAQLPNIMCDVLVELRTSY